MHKAFLNFIFMKVRNSRKRIIIKKNICLLERWGKENCNDLLEKVLIGICFIIAIGGYVNTIILIINVIKK